LLVVALGIKVEQVAELVAVEQVLSAQMVLEVLAEMAEQVHRFITQSILVAG
jgi:hypothetical protein